MCEQGRVAYYDRRPGLACGSLKRLRGFICKGHHGYVGRVGVSPEAGDEGANIHLVEFQVRENEHWTFGFGCGGEPARVRERLDAVMEVLQPVHELAGRHQLFIKYERQRLGHAVKVMGVTGNCKIFSARRVCAKSRTQERLNTPMFSSVFDGGFGLDGFGRNFYSALER